MHRVKRIAWSQILIRIVLTVYTLACLLPMLLVVIVSFTDENAIIKNGYSFFPESFSLDGYRALLSNDMFFSSIMVSLFVTVVGTILAVVITGMAAYGLAHPMVKYRAQMSMFFYITMVFHAGMVPWYLVCNKIGLTENVFALLIPRLMFTTFNLFLIRNYMNGIDRAIMESAIIDGASDIRIAFSIYFPLALPVFATVGLFYSIDYWNDWYNAVMLVPFIERLYPVQYLLFKIQNEMALLDSIEGSSTIPPSESFKMATVVITIGPVVLFYPYLQRYFVKGITVGAVKG